MGRTLRATEHVDGGHRHRRHGLHRARSYRDAVPALLSLVVLIAITTLVALTVLRPRPAAGDPTAGARHPQTGGVPLVVSAADRRQCIAYLTTVLHADLEAMDSGLPAPGTSTDQVSTARWPLGSPQRAWVKTAYDTLLLTAASDLFGTYARDVEAEVAGYGPRIAAACG